MSTTLVKRSLRDALADAAAFRELFAGCYERWEIAGSVRRRKDEVGDVEHVIIPRFADLPGSDLFATPVKTNLLWRRCDNLLAIAGVGVLAKHVYGRDEHGAPKHRWGDVYRGMDFRDFNHEIFCADVDNWGSVLAIRTGPPEFSRSVVSRLHRNMRRNHLGRVWECVPCPELVNRRKCDKQCELCEGTQLKPVMVIPVATEQVFFSLAGVAFMEPEKRQ